MEKAKTTPAEPGTVLEGFRAKIVDHRDRGGTNLCIGGDGYSEGSYLVLYCDEETLSRFPIGTVFDLVVAGAPAETPDQRAERLLGKWLVENYGWNILVDGNRDDYRCRLRHGESDFYLYSGYGPTKAEAILDALRKAGCKDV